MLLGGQWLVPSRKVARRFGGPTTLVRMMRQLTVPASSALRGSSRPLGQRQCVPQRTIAPATMLSRVRLARSVARAVCLCTLWQLWSGVSLRAIPACECRRCPGDHSAHPMCGLALVSCESRSRQSLGRLRGSAASESESPFAVQCGGQVLLYETEVRVRDLPLSDLRLAFGAGLRASQLISGWSCVLVTSERFGGDYEPPDCSQPG